MSLYFIIFSLFVSNVYASIGSVSRINGHAEIKRANQTRELKINDTLDEHDVLTTAKSTLVKVLMSDQTSVQLGPESTLELMTYQQSNQLRQQVYNLLQGKLRSIVEQKAKEGESIQFKTQTVSLGVRGTHFLVNATSVLGTPSTDVALLEGKIAANLGPGKIPLPEFSVEQGQYFSTHQIAKDKTLDSIKKLSPDQLAKLMNDADSFLPDLIDGAGNMINLQTALGAGVGIVAGGVVAASSDDKEQTPAVIHTKEVIHVIYKDKEAPDPEDIRTAKEERLKKRKDNECYYWIYKVIPGAVPERFRRERKCDEYDYDL